ncbi:MAG TPA: hypothetical protein PL033_03825 [Candidatus Brocadiia bacterium]|nr:hypothetical protein [Candidatus Brocadiia bacterium]
MSGIEERLNRLEKGSRGLRRWLLISNVIFASLIFAAANRRQADKLTVSELEVVNGNGKTILRLRESPEGGMVEIINKNDKAVCLLTAGEDGGMIALKNNAGGTIFVASTTPDGGGIMTIRNEKSNPVVTAACNKIGRLELRDGTGTTVWTAP